MLRLYNTLTRKKEQFRPLKGKRVGMYVCGVTVYDVCHLGHARSALIFDLLHRYLRHKGYQVTFVRNFTDIDDKIIQRAHQEGRSWKEVAETYTAAYHEDMAKLGIAPADIEPKATEHIGEMVALIGKLMKRGLAYAADGDVYFRVNRFSAYGKLSRRKTDEMLAGVRVEVNERKENPLDFALWKGSKPGEPAWPSPWGEGRPGWHIECSAMSMACLNSPTLDIHGGGEDLLFPHHENEIAQSEGATGKPFARLWVHNGMVRIAGEKMSKSLGNFFTVREVFEKMPETLNQESKREILRYFLLSAHYRGKLDFSDQHLKLAKAALDNYYNMLRVLIERVQQDRSGKASAMTRRIRLIMKVFPKKYEDALNDDLNIPKVLALWQQLITAVNRYIVVEGYATVLKKVRQLVQQYGIELMGVFTLEPETWSAQPWSLEAPAQPVTMDVDALVRERQDARRRKNFLRADQIRRQLAEAGIVIEDRSDGSTRVKR